MSTGSIFHNIVIDSVEQAKTFCDALEQAEQLSDDAIAKRDEPEMVYLVHEHCGSYEDYVDSVVAAFSSRTAANDYILKLQVGLDDQKGQDEKCQKCALFQMYPDDFAEIRDRNAFEKKMRSFCSDVKINWGGE